jgi:uncharacterized protein
VSFTVNNNFAIEAAHKYLSLVKGASIDTWMEIWAENAIVEFPYAPSPYPKRLEGRNAIYHYYKDASMVYELKEEKPIVIYPSSDPLTAVFEISMDFSIISTGKAYNQDYICVVKIRDDERIISYREYWDPIRGLEAFQFDKQ